MILNQFKRMRGKTMANKSYKNEGEGHPAWKGGRLTNAKGYIIVKAPDHHRANKNGYVLEHVLVMEKKLGRKIAFKDGDIHHIDKNKKNNSPENLKLISRREHRFIHGIEKCKKTVFVGGKEEKERGKVVPKEKLPHGYYYLKII